MPGEDRTGPRGAGPGTGRGMGNCTGYATPVFVARCGFGLRHRGAGRGWRHRFFATGVPGRVAITPEQEAADLQAQAELLKTQLDIVQKRIEELNTE